MQKTLCLFLLLTASLNTWADHHAGDTAAIQQLYSDWRDAVEASDIDAYIQGIHADVRMLPPGAAPVVSAASYREFLGPVFAAATYTIQVDQLPQISFVGDDVAVTEYIYTIELHRKDANVGVSEPGALTANRTRSRYFDVLRKNDQGQWRVWRHSWQSFADAP